LDTEGMKMPSEGLRFGSVDEEEVLDRLAALADG
jgi:hypothetical protein